ncbi:MAG: hypothetical protein IPN83_07050 [Holophagales bacterium]|nr:hypothetical protein [Holophagales bacterium]
MSSPAPGLSSLSVGLRGRSISLVVAFFVLLGVVACADGPFEALASRRLLIQCCLLALAALYMSAVLVSAAPSRRFVSVVFTVVIATSASFMALPGLLRIPVMVSVDSGGR